MSNVGFKIKKLREKKDISQEDLASDMNISQSSLSRIENGYIDKIDFLFMQKICDYFSVDSSYFFEKGMIINDIENNNNVVLNNNNGIFNNYPQGLLENIEHNQEQITKLIEVQNSLIESLMKK